MMKRKRKPNICLGLNKCLSVICIGILSLSLCVPVINAQTNNPATDWFKDAVYGIDGPSPPVNIPMVDPTNFDKQMNAWDVEYAAQIAQDAGAGYMVIGATQVDGYLIAPNPVYDKITGRKPGEKCSSRDLIEDYYQALNKRGIKLMLYWTGNGPAKDPKDGAGMGWEGTATPKFKENWFAVTEYYSKKYGDKIAGWWIDGCYSRADSQYFEPELKAFEKALKSGNPNTIVCYNEHVGEKSLESRYGVADFTAGESYGLSMVCANRWVNDIQWHRYMPLFEYCNKGSSYSTNDLINYIKQCKENGGVVTIGTASTGAWTIPFDPIQLEQLKAVKRAIRDNKPLEQLSFDGSKRVEAEYCSSMTTVPNANPAKRLSNSLQSDGTGAGSLKFETVPSKLFIELWASYKNVDLGKGMKSLIASVKPPEKNQSDYQYRLEVRVGGMNGKTIGSIDNVGYVDWFRFVEDESHVTAEDKANLADGFSLKGFNIDSQIGQQDIYLVGVLWGKTSKERDAFTKINAIDISTIAKGELSQLTSKNGEKTVGNFENNDALVYRNLNFKQGVSAFEAYVAVDTPYAGQSLDIYIDAHNKIAGKLIGSLTVEDTKGWETFAMQKVEVENVQGVHDLYIVARGKAGICNFNWFQFIPAQQSDNSLNYDVEAQKLHDMGLYKGISNETFNPDLQSSLDRQTGVVMLLRLFEKEADALDMSDESVNSVLSVFEDAAEIESWAKKCVAYAVKNGIVKGVSDNRFGATENLIGKAYCTLILRNLGYSVDGESYDNAALLLSEKGGLKKSEAEVLNGKSLMKNDLVGISYYSLYATTADGKKPIDSMSKK